MYRMNLAIIGLLLFVIAACSSGSNNTVSLAYEAATACCGWDTQASGGTPAKLTPATQGFQFQFPVGPNSIHQLVAPQGGPLALDQSKTVTANLQITGDSPVFIETQPCTPTSPPGPGDVRLYFQQAGDDWSGTGVYANYRWWGKPLQLAPGRFVLSAALNPSLDQWTNVQGEKSSTAASQFLVAISHIQAIGFGFGGCFGSHGAQLKSGNAVFNMQSYVWQ